MKKKIVEYIGRIQDGGAETLVKDYALLLDHDKFEITILCDDYIINSANYKILKDNNMKVISLFEKNIILCKILRRLFKGKFRGLLFDRKIEELKPDIIHVHLESLDTLRYSKKLNGIKLFYTCHNPPEMMIGEKNVREKKAAKYLKEKYNLHFIALHEDMAKEIIDMMNVSNCAVIRNAINFERFKSVSKSREEIRLELGIPLDAYVIGHNGRFSYQKNHEFLLDVFYKIKKINNKSFLLLIGRGKLKEKIEKQIENYKLKDSVLILSNRSDVPELLKAMNVFVFPSRFEGFGISLIEAQLMGLPCIVSEAIPEETYQSKLITKLSLNDSINTWCSQILQPKSNIDNYGDINNYDMKKEVKRLEKLYLS